MVLLVTDVFVLLTQVLLWVVVGLFAWYVLLRALPRAFLGGLVLLLLLGVAAFTFYQGSPDQGILGDIWRIIAVPFSPIGLILILLLIAFSEVFRGKALTKTGTNLVRIAVPLFLIFSIPAVSYFLAQRAEAEALQIARPAPIEALGGGRRVIVVLAQDTTRLQIRPPTQPAPAPTNTPVNRAPLFPPPEPLDPSTFSLLTEQPIQLTERGNRLTYAGQLYLQERARGTSPLLIVSAGQTARAFKEGDTPENTSEARAASTYIQNRFGVPEGDIIQDPRSPTVHSSAENVRELLRSRNINFGNQLMVVTSAIEMTRSGLTFSREFTNAGTNGADVTIIPRPTDFYTIPPKEAIQQRVRGRDLIERGVRIGDLLPSTDAFALSSKVISEYINSIYYFLRGWIRPVRTL
ncbi:YdcF family protein [Phormidesmis priestleyi]